MLPVMAEKRPAFGPQDHHTPEQRRIAELMQAREKAFKANDTNWITFYTGEINNAQRRLNGGERDVHPVVRDGAARRR